MAIDYENRILFGDALQVLKQLPDGIVQTCVTSPPYWGLRDYGHDRQLGLEETPEEYIEKLTTVLSEVNRVLKDDGTLWLNLGDTYASNTKGTGGRSDKQLSNKGSRFKSIKIKHGVKEKDLVGVPWLAAFALRNTGWYLRSEIIWHKPFVMPESAKDRPTNEHEKLFLLSKSKHYFYDWQAIAEPTVTNGNCDVKNKRNIWKVNTIPFNAAHFAVFPPKLIEPCIKAGSKKGDLVLDPFIGSGTTAEVALKLGRNYLGIDLQEDYKQIQNKRLKPLRNDLFVSKTFAV